jgi:hypothetical protein
MSRNRRRPSRPSTALAERDDRAVLRSRLQQSLNNEELLSESFADLAAQMSDPGWTRLSAQFEQEFTAEGLRAIRAVCRLMAVKNPLIKRGINLRAAYVWAQGVEIAARANGKKRREQDVQAVVSAFLTDPGNERAFTGGAARERLERCLGTDGEFFPTMFVRPTTGEVQIRVVGADEVTDIICNPQDRSEPWYYRRQWVQSVLSADGLTVQKPMEQFHPALDYRPRNRPKSFGKIPVAWDAPMMHVKVGDLEGWQRGIPDAYAAVDWARAYKEFLEDWARLVKSLSRFAWRLTVKGAQRTQARTKLAAAPVDAAGRVNEVGNVAMIPPEQQLDAIPKSGATIDSESGKPLAAMIAAALDVPLTMLLADPGQTGARAVAETLDQPTELAMGQRRTLWSGVYQRILKYCIAEAVRAPDGLLKGAFVVDGYGRETVKLSGNTTADIQVDFPPLSKVDPDRIITSVVAASSTGTLPPEEVARLLLTAMGVKDVETIIDALTDDDGKFLWPAGPPAPPGGGPPAGGDPAKSGAPPDNSPPDGKPGKGGQAGDQTSSEVLSRQADADFGLFGGDRTGPDTAAPTEPGTQPANVYDPEFFHI